MYNRYIPQPDGSYQRTRHPDPTKRPPQPPAKPEQPPAPPPPPPMQSKPQMPPKPPCQKVPSPQQHNTPGSFLQQLLPKDFDTGDLIVILLLLLMAGDSEEGRSNALLTLALYFIM